MRCPLLNKECITAKCAWWAKYTIREPATQEVTVEEHCIVEQIPSMLIELCRNTAGEQKVKEEVRNRLEHIVHNTGQQTKIFAGLAEMSVRRKELESGNTAGK